ncbi:MAG: LPS export ABC transporter ATP-binding protein [Candidatus Bipolaricaulota bacterium]|nr:MAG: LPS export ABC transporter ATP-binding protein [Candidatus Bipolaricaulota bacterium]
MASSSTARGCARTARSPSSSTGSSSRRKTMLEASGLTKSYGGVRVVNGVSFTVERGEVVGLLGPNGAGKTTTFLMIIGFIPAERGEVRLNGKRISHLPFYQRARAGISYLPQEPSVFIHATVEENLRLVLEWSADRERRDALRKTLLEEFTLTEFARRRASTLSAGERRRLEIARSLATSPAYVLLDEPFSGIDPISVADLQERIATLRSRGLGVVITDHNVRDTLAITDRALLIHEGKIMTEGTAEELIADPLARQFYLGHRFREDPVDRAERAG